MKKSNSNEPKKASDSNTVVTAVAYGLATAELVVAATVRTWKTSCAGWARNASTDRDTPKICRNPRERFVWAHGFITGTALGTGIFTIGLCIALWITIQ